MCAGEARCSHWKQALFKQASTYLSVSTSLFDSCFGAEHRIMYKLISNVRCIGNVKVRCSPDACHQVPAERLSSKTYDQSPSSQPHAICGMFTYCHCLSGWTKRHNQAPIRSQTEPLTRRSMPAASEAMPAYLCRQRLERWQPSHAGSVWLKLHFRWGRSLTHDIATQPYFHACPSTIMIIRSHFWSNVKMPSRAKSAPARPRKACGNIEHEVRHEFIRAQRERVLIAFRSWFWTHDIYKPILSLISASVLIGILARGRYMYRDALPLYRYINLLTAMASLAHGSAEMKQALRPAWLLSST